MMDEKHLLQDPPEHPDRPANPNDAQGDSIVEEPTTADAPTEFSEGILTRERDERRSSVLPYLEKLRIHLAEQGIRDISLSVPVGKERILLSPTEQRLFADRSQRLTSEDAVGELLLDAIGVQVKILASVRKLKRTPAPEHEPRVAAVTADCDVAHRICHEMTVMLRKLREEDRTAEAKTVQERRNSLSQSSQNAEQTCKTLTAPGEEADSAAGTRVRANPMAATARRKHTTTVRVVVSAEAARAHRKRSLIALVAASAILLFVLAGLWGTRPRELADFSPEDFDHIAGIENVVNRSPVLLVILSESEWTSMTIEEKREVVEEVGKKIRPAGYDEAEFRTRTTHGLAVWRRNGIVEIRH